jgi:hypothetical protein
MGYAAAGGSKGGEEITSRSIRYWHLADNPTAPVFVRFRARADIAKSEPLVERVLAYGRGAGRRAVLERGAVTV